MNPLSATIILLILAAVFWFIWPVLRPTVAMQQSEAGELETELTREELTDWLAQLEEDANANPDLLTSADWLRIRSRVWAQLNYLDMCDTLNARNPE